MRIISVVPSFTELLFDLGLETQIVGITRFCIHPKEKVKRITKIGGTKSLKIDRILALKPDLVIANKEENSKGDIEELAKHCNVLVTEIYNLTDAIQVIVEVGKLTNTRVQANAMATNITLRFEDLKNKIISNTQKVAYLIWEKPMMIAGRNTFINALLQEMNWENIYTDEQSRYPEITKDELQKLAPDLILLSSEPYPFKTKHQELYTQNYPSSKVLLVDGEMFSWYGSKLLQAPKYFEQLLNDSELK